MEHGVPETLPASRQPTVPPSHPGTLPGLEEHPVPAPVKLPPTQALPLPTHLEAPLGLEEHPVPASVQVLLTQALPAPQHRREEHPTAAPVQVLAAQVLPAHQPVASPTPVPPAPQASSAIRPEPVLEGRSREELEREDLKPRASVTGHPEDASRDWLEAVTPGHKARASVEAADSRPFATVRSGLLPLWSFHPHPFRG